MPETVPLKYRAFLSYSHRDTADAKGLHGSIEGFRIDKDLIGRATPMGPIPSALRPVFRDRHDFDAGGTLAQQTISALDQSAALVVLASRDAAASKAVNEEIRLFKSRHPDRPVIPLITLRATGDVETECFPPALRFEVNGDGAVTDMPAHPLAADLREQGDGRQLALSKVIARLIGLAPDEVYRRAERARKRAANVRNGVIAVLAFLTVAAGASAYFFYDQLKRNEAFLTATLKTATEIVNTAVAQAEKFGVPRGATLELLGRAERLFDDMALLGQPTPELQRQKAWMLIEFARNYEIVGDTARQRQKAEEAHEILASLSVGKNSDMVAELEADAASDERARALMASGKPFEALALFQKSLETAKRAVSQDPTHNGWRRILAMAESNVGILMMLTGNQSAARDHQQAALDHFRALAAHERSDDRTRKDIAAIHLNLGGAQLHSGDIKQALENLEAAHVLAKELLGASPSDFGLQAITFKARLALCEARQTAGDHREALVSCEEAVAFAQKAVASDPTNAVWQANLAHAHRISSVSLFAIGDIQGAQRHNRSALAILDQLTTKDPSNFTALEELATGHSISGLISFAQRDMQSAFKSFQASAAVAERHLGNTLNDKASAPGTATVEWQTRMFETYTRLGSLYLTVSSNPAASLDSYRSAAAYAERLASAAPDDVGRRQQLGVSIGRIGSALAKLGRATDALVELKTGRAIFASASSAASELDQEFLKWFDAEIAAVDDKLTEETRKSEILGKWRDADNDTIEYKADGTAVSSAKALGMAQFQLEWRLGAGKTFVMWATGMAIARETCSYELDGDTLRLSGCAWMIGNQIIYETTLTRVKD